MVTTENIISKLEYSAKLQRASLPKKRHFDRIFKDSFVIYKPTEYLSGDFYWIAESNNLKFAAVGDCTGHGVSAAFLSMLGYNFLNHALHNKGYTNLNLILKELDKQMIEAFSTVNGDPFDNDWIDISIISYNEKTCELSFAGANRKALIIEGDQYSLLKGGKYPIGGWQLEENRDFPVTNLNISKVSNVKVYLGSDGFQDQFNDILDKKFTSKRLHKLIYESRNLSMQNQRKTINTELENWMFQSDQTDDICLLGVEF